MVRSTATIAATVVAGALLIAGSAFQPTYSQTITFGPNGVRVNPDSPPRRPPDNYRDRDYDRSGDRGDRRNYRDRWREVRHRMMRYRDECRYGNRGACVKLGIIIGQNQDRRDEWRRQHPDYFWWDRD